MKEESCLQVTFGLVFLSLQLAELKPRSVGLMLPQMYEAICLLIMTPWRTLTSTVHEGGEKNFVIFHFRKKKFIIYFYVYSVKKISAQVQSGEHLKKIKDGGKERTLDAGVCHGTCRKHPRGLRCAVNKCGTGGACPAYSWKATLSVCSGRAEEHFSQMSMGNGWKSHVQEKLEAFDS